jgi:hypothetical protein
MARPAHLTALDASGEPHVKVRTEGQRMLLHVTGSLQAIAHEVGIKSPQTIHCWKTGAKVPSPHARAQLWAAFGIPVQAWTLKPGALLTRPGQLAGEDVALAPTPAPETGSTTLDDCMALLAVVQRERSQPGLVASERVKLADAEARILALRSRLEQAAELSELRYVTEHPSWLRLKRTIVKALEPHPVAARAVMDALDAEVNR